MGPHLNIDYTLHNGLIKTLSMFTYYSFIDNGCGKHQLGLTEYIGIGAGALGFFLVVVAVVIVVICIRVSVVRLERYFLNA